MILIEKTILGIQVGDFPALIAAIWLYLIY